MRLKIYNIMVVAMFLTTWQLGYADTCGLLTEGEVEEITGQKVDSVGVQSGYGNCIYYRNVNIFGQIMKAPLVTVGYTRSDVQSRWDYWNSRPDKEVIPGLGDEAVWSPGGAFLVCRVKGGLLMIMIWGEVGDGSKKDMAVQLARKAITRIK